MVMKAVRIAIGVVNLLFGLHYGVLLMKSAILLGNARDLEQYFSVISHILFLSFFYYIFVAFMFMVFLAYIFKISIMIISAVYFFKTALYGTHSVKKRLALPIASAILLASYIYIIPVLGGAKAKSFVYLCALIIINIALLLYDYLHPDLREEDEA